MSISVIILAAGFGTRMKSAKPKVLHEICFKPMIYYAIKEAKQISNDISVVLYHEADMVKNVINKYFDDIKFIIQDVKNFPGTGGALRGVSFQNEKVLILNADMPLVTFESLKLLCLKQNAIAVFKTKNPFGYGRVLIEDKKVKSIVEEKDANEKIKKINIVNAGIYIFDKSFLQSFIPKITNENSQKEYYLTDLVKLATNHDVKMQFCKFSEHECYGVNSKLHLSIAEQKMQKRINEAHMINGVIIRLPKTVLIDPEVSFIDECEVESGVIIKGKTTIKKSHIKANSIIEESIISNSDIGPLARIRPNSDISNTHIGNFVEIKKSTLRGVKAGHLSYLGDSFIDEGTNVGCGSITCNYDGVKKHLTKIGKNVFIGSDTQLVAPVNIENNVIIAAGTTVTKDVKEGELVISRVKQTQISGFYDKHFKAKD